MALYKFDLIDWFLNAWIFNVVCFMYRCLHGAATSLSSTWFLYMCLSCCWWAVTQTEFLLVRATEYAGVSLTFSLVVAKEWTGVQCTVSWFHWAKQQFVELCKICPQMLNLCWRDTAGVSNSFGGAGHTAACRLTDVSHDKIVWRSTVSSPSLVWGIAPAEIKFDAF